MTEDQRDFTSLMRDRLSGVVDFTNFPTLPSHVLFEIFADIFIPRFFLTPQEVQGFLPPNFWRP